ncbi:MAG: chromosomal replication initiator protein DnaA, partial [Treponema sp.]|nr:chromosomal replication initiator protein DnaA [Treponema sp.]
FKLWFNMEYVKDTLSEITVSVPSEFMWKSMVQRGYVEAVQTKIFEMTGQNVNINHIPKNSFVLPSSPTNTEDKKTEIQEKKIPEGQPKISNQQIKKQSAPDIHKKQTKLDDKFTFDSFVLGENSELAYKASQAAADNPGKAYNPLLIYGDSGLGKTHLMQAIGNYIYEKNNGDMKIRYLTAENFTNEFTSSIRDNSTEKFKSKYRNLDVLLLDDIHFLQGKTQTQEELFYTFEALDAKKSQMVFTCDRPISELKDITDRLRTRFAKGMTVNLNPPNYETRYAIIQKKLEIMEKSIPNDVIDYIAKNVQNNVRELESCLVKMLGYADLLGKPVNMEIAQKQLSDTITQPSMGAVTIDTIQKVVAEHYNISIGDLKSRHRSKKVLIPRQIAIYIARELCDYSYPELGNEFGGKDHTTILHSYEKIVDQLKTDTVLNSTIQMLIRNIKNYKK